MPPLPSMLLLILSIFHTLMDCVVQRRNLSHSPCLIFVLTQTGAVVQVPSFVEVSQPRTWDSFLLVFLQSPITCELQNGTKIKIDTRTGEYLSKAN